MKIYTYKSCSTCRNALKWLESRGMAVENLPIRETPPSEDELRAMLGYLGGELRRLFNTSGRDYRELGLKDQLSGMSEGEAITLLAGNGNLIKRPFLLGDDFGVTGFKEAEWADKLGSD